METKKKPRIKSINTVKSIGLFSTASKSELDSGDSNTVIPKTRQAKKVQATVKKKITSDKIADKTSSILADNGSNVRRKSMPPVINLNEIVSKIHQNPRNFVNLTYTVPKTSEFFTPYSLMEVPYAKVNPDMFFTMSQNGVTCWSSQGNTFTELSVWLNEYNVYSNLIKIKSFHNFRLWKGFKVWEKTIRWQKFMDYRKFLSENLFILSPPLARAILKLRHEYCNFIGMVFVDASILEKWHLFYFIESQMKSYEHSRDALLKFRKDMNNIIYEACHMAVISKGFHPDDEATIYPTMKKLKEMMSYTDRMRKRRYLIVIGKFLNFCDYMTISFLHIMLRNTFEQLAHIFRCHDNLAPTNDQLENMALDEQIEPERPVNQPQKPLFLGELMLTSNLVMVDPSREVMLHIINQLIDLILSAARDIPRFQTDARFVQFTHPSIRGIQEERLCGAPVDLDIVLQHDHEMSSNKKFIITAIDIAYDKATKYVERFEDIRVNYELDCNTDHETIRSEKDLKVLRKYCERYYKEMSSLEGILPNIKLGLLLLEQGTFKEEVIPVCTELLQILESHIPNIAIETVKILSGKAEDTMIKLTTPPMITIEYVLYMRYLENCDAQIDKLIEEVDYAYNCFMLMKDYSIEIDEVEKEKYMDCEDLILQCKEVREDKLSKKPEYVEALDNHLQIDIKNLLVEVEEVRGEVIKDWFLDETSNPIEIKESLQNFTERLTQCQSQAEEYRKYQKEFKIDITRYDALDEVLQEVKHRQMLWDSKDEWNTALDTWNHEQFNDLSIDDLTAVNAKILRNCTLLEKNLPPNKIVPKVRTEAELFKAKLPLLTCLRNPALKARHWIQIEALLNKKLYMDDSVNLTTFVDANAFSDEFSEKITELSGQASAEQSLEVILKNVENSWKDLELAIIPYKDAKDVFILAGIDEIQTVLDESNININTIAASRHVGPIKSKVHDWRRDLNLFAETLDEWMKCQTSWIYLEAIFSAPDIQRQLPEESRKFTVVDKNWKDVLRRVYKMPWALPAMTDERTLKIMQQNNILLEEITRCLEAYLEVKRVAFPRFYFLSNDELLEILAQTKNPHAVQPHLRKCFDAIASLHFAVKDADTDEPILTNDILAMISPEGEKILLGIGLKARGPVEDWLGKVEEAMFIALKRCMKFAFQCYPVKDRSLWFQEHPNQMVLIVSQQQWAAEVHAIFDSSKDGEKVHEKMKEFEKKIFVNLQKLAAIARTDIEPLLRKILCALITIDVHARDTITNMVKNKVVKSTDFDWLKMLRYYWIDQTQTIQTKMSSASLPYFYEYLGAGGVLVITPLTDRCYLCLMGALQMDLGGAPAGPAGTGKTETTKDLAKALAKQCVVFNCSEGLDYKMMGRFFSGLAQSGAWCCFDEFNRIDIEVLSVIAQQLTTIRNAKLARMNRFMFEGHEIKLNMSCAAFITMNPGYAGRTELPDNLKALFRPIAMMVPDYALIAEVILYSEGFEGSKILARKMVHMYKLCSEQLSQQDHYDFGMRAVKSVLVMAGALKRSSPDQNEDITLIASLRDSNLPKFLADDCVLFTGILSDLFPGVVLPEIQYGILQDAIEYSMKQKNLQINPELILKTIQLYETMCVRWGVMLVGLTCGGKTCILHTLAESLEKLFNDGHREKIQYRPVNIQTLNPKSITLDELYGSVNPMTLEWKDGLLGLAVRHAVVCTEEEHQWVVCDGPVDAVWIENLNTVLDDNKMLCLANSERIKLTDWVHMLFEVDNLNQASPATVSRCGMVYIDPNDLGWKSIVKSWIFTIPSDQLSEDLCNYVTELFDKFCTKCLSYARHKCLFLIEQVEINKIRVMCVLLTALLKQLNVPKIEMDAAKLLLQKIFIWALLWAVGGNFIESSKILLEQFIRKLCAVADDETSILPETDLWDYKINVETKDWEPWTNSVEDFIFKRDISFFDMLVPTIDTTKYGYLAQLLFRQNQPVMFTGDTGVGKSILAQSVLMNQPDTDILPVFINFSAQTSSIRTQEMVELRLEKRTKTLFGPPIGKKIILFVDDVNMPKLDTYGSQPPIELLRQLIDFHGFYDRNKMFWKGVQDVILGSACAPPGGGRNPLTPRFVRHFALLLIPPPSTTTLTTIFSKILVGFLDDFNAVMKPLGVPIINAAVDVYNRIAEELLPTPTKSHYVFNLRDLSKCVQGILQADATTYHMPTQIHRLFYHESMRVFHDRLINNEDKIYFKNLLKTVCLKYFDNPIVKDDESLIFGDFLIFGQEKEKRIYEEIYDITKLKSVLFDYLDDYNSVAQKKLNLILFQDAIEHICRIARIFRSERGNGLLVGVSGMGKRVLTRLASHINGFECIGLQYKRGYGLEEFHEDLRKLYLIAGANNKSAVFLINDTEITQEEFLEDLNTILNSGDVPNLFESDEYEDLLRTAKPNCYLAKWKDCSRDGIFQFVISKVRSNLHIVLCMSPVGDAFRKRCRLFPSLVNCCTINWFSKWPPEALYSVAHGSLKDVSASEQQNEHLAKICIVLHESVEDFSIRLREEYHRYYYTTPSSYLELLKLYHSLIKSRTDVIIAKQNRIKNGLDKLLETNDVVAVMQEELTHLFPKLEVQSNEMKSLLDKLAEDNKVVDVFKRRVLQDETDARAKEVIARGIADEALKDLEVATPALKAAQEALKAINKNDINELKSFATPPQLVQFVMESVCILFNVKPTWESAKKLMTDVNFLKKLMEFDKEHISETTLRKIKRYIEHKDFDPVKIEKVSKVAKSVSLWVLAMDKFAKVYKIVEPKIIKSREAENELKQIMAILKQKQQELADVEAKIQSLQDLIDEKNKEFQVIQDSVNLTTGRLNRATRLTSALADEEVRWSETVKQLSSELWAIPGDVLTASACIAYLGAFPSNYRKELTNLWVNECKKYNIPSSTEFNVISVLGDAYEIRNWNVNYLPKDEVSIENGLIVTRALRWPLMIDPQEQANRWIRSLEKDNDLQIIKMTDTNLMRILELCIRQGFPLLIEDIEETLDPTLAPILARATYTQAGRLLIRLGDSDIDYDNNFKLYMTTKLSNPNYLPEVCITVTLVNFLVTVSGLEDQLLGDIISIELPALEKQRSDLIVRINDDKQSLLQLEDKILRLLFAAEGNILDDEELVETLNESKETSAIIAARLEDTVETELVITETREKYRILAARGAILYFVVTSLAEIDPMYQYSLKYFSSVFAAVIAADHEQMQLVDRLNYLLIAETKAIFQNVSQGLFVKHKLIFSFLLCIAIERQMKNVTDNEFNFLLRGPIGSKTVKPKPQTISLNEYQWKCCTYLEYEFKKAFNGLTTDLDKPIQITLDDFNETLHFGSKASGKLSKNWNESLTDFQKVILINSVLPQKLVMAIGSYVRKTLGNQFTETISSNSLAALYASTSNKIPLIFILSTGSDPTAEFLRFSEEMNYLEKLNIISLGQGQGPIAEKLIEKCRTLGHWVFLQNCHLATSWMPRMELIIRDLSLGVTKADPNFRIFFTSMPTPSFPVSVLQNSVKVTNEPPKGLKANLLRALNDLSVDYFEIHALQDKWRKIIFGLCTFHGILLERRKFGPLGWNIQYEFTEDDRECALKILNMYCDREIVEDIPWDALEYINGQITWGGRVTDYWDQRCLIVILKIFSSPRILEENYSYSSSGIYRYPINSTLEQCKQFVSALPHNDEPEIFGMHENANVVCQLKETQFFIGTLLVGQPRQQQSSSESSANKNDEITLDMIQHITDVLSKKILLDTYYKELYDTDAKGRVTPLTTVLLQEIDRYNKLLVIIHDHLINLRKAIQGYVVMSESLEEIFNAFLNNTVPMIWSNKGFLSTKPLGHWVRDFQYRIDFIETWLKKGLPSSFWISGFYFPQSFLTGTLQTHARRHNLPIDSLKIDFEILPHIIRQANVYENHQLEENVESENYSGIKFPNTGIIVHGLFIEAGRWDPKHGGLCDAKIGEIVSNLPAIWLKPCTDLVIGNRYEAPLYKTQDRAGVLSTTGHSTNFVLAMLLESKLDPDFWIMRGTALFTAVNE